MTHAPNHNCIICGKAYYTCNKCEKVNSWRMIADTIECYQTYLAYIQYRDGNMNDKDFATVLKENDFVGKEVLPALQETFDKLLGVKRTTKVADKTL